MYDSLDFPDCPDYSGFPDFHGTLRGLWENLEGIPIFRGIEESLRGFIGIFARNFHGVLRGSRGDFTGTRPDIFEFSVYIKRILRGFIGDLGQP